MLFPLSCRIFAAAAAVTAVCCTALSTQTALRGIRARERRQDTPTQTAEGSRVPVVQLSLSIPAHLGFSQRSRCWQWPGENQEGRKLCCSL